MKRLSIVIEVSDDLNLETIRRMLTTDIEDFIFNKGFMSKIELISNTPIVPNHVENIVEAMEMTVLQREAQNYIDKGDVIQAIKHVRNKTGWGLKESKDYVDKLREGR